MQTAGSSPALSREFGMTEIHLMFQMEKLTSRGEVVFWRNCELLGLAIGQSG
jgi:hypothetical protein